MQQSGPAITRRVVSVAEGRAASRRWWDHDADSYQEEHGAFLGDVDLVWCPEGLREAEAGLLGAVGGTRVLELGCGAAAGSRWLDGQGARVTALDLSAGMLRQARLAAGAGVFDTVHSAFGAVPFVADSAALMREVFRVLRPGGAWVFAVTHPLRWVFLDDAGEGGLVAVHSYFDRRPYVEEDVAGVPTYIEAHRTVGDRIRDLTAAGFVLRDMVEPEWPPGHEETWGQWSPLRGRLIPGTAIFVAERPAT